MRMRMRRRLIEIDTKDLCCYWYWYQERSERRPFRRIFTRSFLRVCMVIYVYGKGVCIVKTKLLYDYFKYHLVP